MYICIVLSAASERDKESIIAFTKVECEGLQLLADALEACTKDNLQFDEKVMNGKLSMKGLMAY